MPAQSWATKDQQAWLIQYQQKYYLPLMPSRNYTSFWNPYFEAFAAKWPEREQLFPSIPEAELTPEQREQVTTALKDRKNKLTNWMRVHSRPKKPVIAGASKLPDLLVVEQEGRHLSPLEVFSKLYYKSHVKHLVKQETEDEKVPVDVIRKATITAWQCMQVNEPDKAEIVVEECKRRKEEREKELEDRENPTADQIAATIRRAPTLLINALQKVQKSTKWSFTLLFGGPDPDSDGSLRSGCIHLGETDVGGNFGDCYVDFDDKVMKPYHKFLTRLYPTAPDGDTPKTDCSESRTATPAPGSSVGTSADSSRTATPTPGLSAGMSADSSRTITPVPGAEHEHSGAVAPTPLANLEHSGTATVVFSTEPSRTGTPAVSESAAAVTPNPSACEPSHLLVSPSVQDTPDSDLSAPKEPAPLPSCGLTLSQPVSHEIQPSSWDLKLDTPFCFDELYAPLPGDTVSDPSTMSPFIWSHASATPFSNVPNDYSISFAPYIGHQVPVLPEFPNWNLDPGIIQVPNPQVNFALPTNERSGDNTIASTTHQTTMISYPAAGTSLMTLPVSQTTDALANSITLGGEPAMNYHPALPSLSSMISPQVGQSSEKSSSAHKRAGSESVSEGNSLGTDFGRGKRVRIASKRAEEANAIGSRKNNNDHVSGPGVHAK